MTPNRLSPLCTDLYQLTMAQAYFSQGIDAEATFSLFIRPNPKRPFYLAAGLGPVLEQLANWSFSSRDLQYLEGLKLFSKDFLKFLEKLRFSGRIRAMDEGTVFFANEPLLELTAPILQAQLLETWLINSIGTATIMATKAARCVQAARGKTLVDFSLRRTHGMDAGLVVARSAYLAGFSATSNVLAGKLFNIPVSGTMAHSFVMAFENEIEAFRAYARTFPHNTVLLIDTYDTIAGARNAITVALEMEAAGLHLAGVRLDSGAMVSLSRKVRTMLDQAGLKHVKLFASSGFDEFKIDSVLRQKAAFDAFGVGTKLGVSADAPYLDMVYKLVRYNGKEVRKLSPGKKTLAGEKQVFRLQTGDGRWRQDILALATEPVPAGASGLLQPVMEAGRIVKPSPGLETIRSHFRDQFDRLDQRYKSLESAENFPVSLSPALKAIQDTRAS